MFRDTYYGNRRHVSLSGLLTGTIAVLVITVTALIVLIGSMMSRRAVLHQSGRQLSVLSRQASDRIDQFLWARQSEVRLLRDLIESNDFEQTEIRSILTRFQRHLPMFAWIGLADESGTVQVASNNRFEGVSLAARPFFRESLAEPYTGDVRASVRLSDMLERPANQPPHVIDFSFPVRDELDAHLYGVLVAHVDLQWIREIRAEFLASLPEDSVDFRVFSPVQNMYIAGSSEIVGTPVPQAILDGTQGSDGYRVLEDTEPLITGYAESRGYRTFSGFGWITEVTEPVRNVLAAPRQQERAIWITGIVIAMFAAMLGHAAARAHTLSLRHLQRQSEALRLGGREIFSRDSRIREFADLGESLDYLSQELSRTEFAAHTDAMTGLLNRSGAVEWFERARASCARYDWRLVVLAIDLDGFKQINDAWGHAAGDEVLKVCAYRIRSRLRPDELAARWGGDEFTAVGFVRDGETRTTGDVIAERILTSIREPILYEGQDLYVGCSIGLHEWLPQSGETWESAHEHADEALYAAKRSGKNRAVWS